MEEEEEIDPSVRSVALSIFDRASVVVCWHAYCCKKYTENRRNMLAKAEQQGLVLYPHKFQVSHSIPQFIRAYSHLQPDQRLENEHVSLAGRSWRGQLNLFELLLFTIFIIRHIQAVYQGVS